MWQIHQYLGGKISPTVYTEDTDLYRLFEEPPFPYLPGKNISLVVDALEELPKEMVVHRLTGDGKRAYSIPRWSWIKLRVI